MIWLVVLLIPFGGFVYQLLKCVVIRLRGSKEAPLKETVWGIDETVDYWAGFAEFVRQKETWNGHH